MNRQYWASVHSTEIADNIKDKWKDYQSWLSSSNQAQRIRKQYSTYYGFGQFGLVKDGSLSRVSVNIYKNIIDHIQILVSQNKLTYECAARNTDSESLAQARIAKSYIDFILSEKKLDTILSNSLLHGLILTEVWVAAPWDSLSGDDIAADPETGELVRSGKQTFEILTPFEVARDTRNSSAASEWVIIKRTVNRWNLAAQYPKHRDAILDTSRSKQDETLNDFSTFSMKADSDDYVDVFQFFHTITPAMPSGRQTLLCGDAVLQDSPLTYESIPVARFAPADVIGSVAGTSVASDLVGLQQALDKLMTAVTSNQLNLSLTNIWSRHPISVQRLAEGFNVVNSIDPPEPLNLGNSSAETYSTINLYQSMMDKISGVPEIVRGAVPQGVTAGNAMSLLLSQAIAFSSNIQRRYAQFASEVATISINNMKRFCHEPVLVSIAGKRSAPASKEVSKDSFSSIDRVVCTPSNPVSQTQQGREAVAKELLASGQVDGRRYVEILNGAPVDSIFEDVADELSLINSENEVLRDGGQSPVLRTDNHEEHRKRHLALLNSPIVRSDPRLVAAVLDHVQQHEDFLAPPAPQVPPNAPQQMPEPAPMNPPLPDRLAGVKPASLPKNAPPEAQLALDTQG